VFDSEYFRTSLQADVDAMGGQAVVEVHLLTGRMHRLRSVLSVHSGYVTLEAYQPRVDEPTREPRWKEEPRPGTAAHQTQRAVVSYESIATVAITSAHAADLPGIGFART
jgi:hypothetical protein